MKTDNIFRKYDIRGDSSNEITENFALRLGISLIKYIKKEKVTSSFQVINKESKHNAKLKTKRIHLNECSKLDRKNLVLLAYDSRLSSKKLFDSLCKSLLTTGVEVISLGLAPTPLLYFADKIMLPLASIMITASHNPKHDNGFKIIVNGKNFFAKQLVKLGNSLITEIVDINFKSKLFYTLNLLDEYINKVLKEANILPNLKIIWDPGHGSSCKLIKKIVKNLPNINLIINGNSDGNFPNRSPDPTDTNTLNKILQKKKYNIAISFDGDADRIVIIYNNLVLTGEHLFYIFAKDILDRTGHNKFIVDIKFNQTVIDYIINLGGEVIITKTGHPFIKQQLSLQKAIFASEASGHLYFTENYFGYDDGIYASIRFLKLISFSNNDIEVPFFETKELKFNISSTKKSLILKRIKNFLNRNNIFFNNIDGIRVVNNNEWWLIRMSNTEELMMLRFGIRKFDRYYHNNLQHLSTKMILLSKKFLNNNLKIN